MTVRRQARWAELRKAAESRMSRSGSRDHVWRSDIVTSTGGVCYRHYCRHRRRQSRCFGRLKQCVTSRRPVPPSGCPWRRRVLRETGTATSDGGRRGGGMTARRSHTPSSSFERSRVSLAGTCWWRQRAMASGLCPPPPVHSDTWQTSSANRISSQRRKHRGHRLLQASHFTFDQFGRILKTIVTGTLNTL